VSAEQLIALEAALMELGTLYAVARSFAALRADAETKLLPCLLELGSTLRRLLRTARLSADEIDRASRQILELRTRWQTALEEVRSSGPYQQALQAWAADEQDALVHLIPRIFAGVHVLRSAPALFVPVSPSSGRRRPGNAPFLSAAECADRIAHSLAVGIEPDSGGSDWWERELPYIMCADTFWALETPIALRLAMPNPSFALFMVTDEPTCRIFTPRLCAPMGIVLAAEATDEWWQAYDESYASFIEALRYELATRDLGVAEFADRA
jgi:hypothetical protein